MSNPIRQHWVPQFYLRYFATPESQGKGREQVWAVARHKKAPLEPLRSSTKCVAVEKLLYSPRKSDGTRDFALETKLTDLEGCLAGRWPDFSGQQIKISKGSQKTLALFLATLYLRHPAQRQAVVETHRKIVEQVANDLKTFDKAPSHLTYLINGKERRLRVDEFEEYKNATANDHHRSFVSYLRRGAVPLAELLLKKRWSFIVADSPAFVTCDNPMSLRGPHYTGGKFGFGTPGMTVDFPVSPHVLLHLDDGNGLKVCPLEKNSYSTDRPWSAFNCEMWTNASRFMFCPRDPYEVLREIIDFSDFAKANYQPDS